MAFQWLDKFCSTAIKSSDYAEKTLSAYALGIRAKGSIAGVVIRVAADCCDAARRLPENKLYQPENAPHLPLPDCSLGNRC